MIVLTSIFSLIPSKSTFKVSSCFFNWSIFSFSFHFILYVTNQFTLNRQIKNEIGKKGIQCFKLGCDCIITRTQILISLPSSFLRSLAFSLLAVSKAFKLLALLPVSKKEDRTRRFKQQQNSMLYSVNQKSLMWYSLV